MAQCPVVDCVLVERIDRHLIRMDEHMARGNELMEQIREEHRLNRQEHRLNRAFIEDSRKVIRELVLEVREGTEMLRGVRHGIQAQTEGLLHVLEELRRRNGPGGQAAT